MRHDDFESAAGCAEDARSALTRFEKEVKTSLDGIISEFQNTIAGILDDVNSSLSNLDSGIADLEE